MANEIQYRNHTAYNNGTSAENNIKLLDITPFQHEDLSSGVNKLGKMLVAQSFCEPVAVCNSNNPQNGAYVATCSNYPDFALSYQDAQQNTQYLIGLKIRVIFTYGITYGSVSGGTYPTLNINGSGAIPMLAQGKTMATGSASAGQTLEFTVIPYGNGVAFDADSNVRESTSDYTIYTDGKKVLRSRSYRDVTLTINSQYAVFSHNLNQIQLCAQITHFYKSGGRLDYLFTVQNSSAQAIVIYVRRADGETIPDGTQIDVNITLSFNE